MEITSLNKITQNDDLDAVVGLKLQPLVNLITGDIVAWEVLTKTEDVDPEFFFSHLAKEYHLALFLWQAKEVLACSGNFWLNLPVRVYCDPYCMAELLKVEHQYRLTLEIQDPESLLRLNVLEMMQFKAGVETLRQAGWRVWIDDLTPDIAQDIVLLNLHVDGVKVDKQALGNPITLADVIDAASQISPHILVEGIETRAMYDAVLQTKALYGQGYFWPEKLASIRVPAAYSQSGKTMLVDNLLKELHQIKVFVSCPDNFFALGISHILWSLAKSSLHEQFEPSIRLVKNEREADVIIRECSTGEQPFDCHNNATIYQREIKYKQHVLIHNFSHGNYLLSCPGIEGAISLYDQPSRVLMLLNKIIPRVEERRTGNELPKTRSVCSLCYRKRLTDRESAVISLMQQGESPNEIAERFNCTQKVISSHKRTAMKKLNMKSNMDFYRYLNRTAMEKVKQNNGASHD
jgi:EAL domain-containing protein (putative c-di-GMP-specific phosphodiesterase class I)/DNA-binding CsgD family transcriptional regulator